MKRLVCIALISAPLCAENLQLWRWSLAAMSAASSADAATSWGWREKNPLYGQHFEARGLAIKAGATGGFEAFELWMRRRHPKATSFLTITNFAATGVWGFAAIHNARLHSQAK